MEINALEKIEELLKGKVVVGYIASKNEINPFVQFPFVIDLSNYVPVPAEKDSDPFFWAAKYQERYQHVEVAVLVPGSAFDVFGTRHGRGGGWYDRFLSKVPKEWDRIGVAHQTDFSRSKLKRESWDEPMDWIIVKTGNSWEIHETNARKA